jgi:hypothetical protein
MRDKPKIIVICVVMLSVLGAYYAIAFIFIAINLLSKELAFAIEHNSMGVYFHILFISLVHILAVFLFIYSAIGISKLNKTARKMAIIVVGLNIFTVFIHTYGWFMTSIRIAVFIVSFLTFCLLLCRNFRQAFREEVEG